jgi:hypothetical protein
MEYIINEDHYNGEFDIEFLEGGSVFDGDIEPDLLSNLLVKGILEPVVVKGSKKKIKPLPKTEDQ